MEIHDLVDEPYTGKVKFHKNDNPEVKAKKEAELEKLRKMDRKCRLQVVQRIADSHLEYVKDAETAHEMWTTLRDTFERKGVASQLLLRKTLLTLKSNSNNQSTEAHFLKFDKLIRELRSTGATLKETDVVCHLLLTMPSEYDTVVTALETLTAENLTLSFVKNRLLEEELKISGARVKSKKEEKQNIAFATSVGKSTGNGHREKFTFKCYNCGIVGPKISECRKLKRSDLKKQEFEAKSTAMEEDFYCFHSTEEELKNGTGIKFWFLVSGTSEHLTKSDRFLENARISKNKIKIGSAKSGLYLVAEKIGNIRITTIVAGYQIPVVIKDVPFVPGLELNLLSVRRLELNGLKIVFADGEGQIWKGKKMLATALRNHKLYELQIWHKRVGHMNVQERKIVYGSDVKDVSSKNETKNIQDVIKCKQEGKNTIKKTAEEYEENTIKELEEVVMRRSGQKKNLPRCFDGSVILALNAEQYVDDLPQTVQEKEEREDRENCEELKVELKELKKEKGELEKSVEAMIMENKKKMNEFSSKMHELEDTIKNQQKVISESEDYIQNMSRKYDEETVNYKKQISELNEKISRFEEELKKEKKSANDHFLMTLRRKLAELETTAKEEKEKNKETLKKLTQVQEQVRKKEVQWLKEKDNFKRHEGLLQQKLSEKRNQFDTTCESLLEIRAQKFMLLKKEKIVLAEKTSN